MRRISIILTTLLLLPSLFLSATNVQTGGNVNVDQPKKGNLYLVGGKVNVHAKIGGDLIAAGGKVYINDTLAEDALILGGQTEISGYTGGDVRVVSGKLIISGNIAGDLNVTGGQVTILSNVVIGGDLLVAGGKVNLEGKVMGSVNIAGGELHLTGDINGDLEAYGGKLYLNGTIKGHSKIAAEHINLDDKCIFAGDVTYWTKHRNHLNFTNHLSAGAAAHFDKKLMPVFYKQQWKQNMYRISSGYWVFRLSSNFLLVFLLLAFFDKTFNRYSGHLQANLGKSLGLGSLLLLLVPLVSGLAMVTIIGIPVGVIGFGLFAGMVSISQVLPAVLGAYALRDHQHANWNRGALFLIAGGFYLGLQFVSRFTFLGSIVQFVAAAIALGFVYMILRKKLTVEPVVASTPESGEPKAGDQDFV